MSSSTRSTRTASRGGGGGSAWVTGGTMFAGVLMLMEGSISILSGIAAIAEDDVYRRVGDYVFKFNLTTWGWIHLILGILVAVTGWGILQGAAWARAVGVALAALVAVLQFMWLPYQPIWAVVSIALAVFVIWALTSDHGRGSDPDRRSAH
ncbi:hypothetical protein GLX30_23015 [Streptomyces sp. Tu 2975]|uniref:DUF7144 family membrane protein n=1 Tax=Streptomyces sp. Tu 2975 TaxID=2676871 RepID=UPI001358CEE3|nr:hypothetical protein [Streptomyces sp. Tu 2975]QIP86418.1 hypothetical protein GLX30_23015 [Streptomyces sp. Tu 2975]